MQGARQVKLLPLHGFSSPPALFAAPIHPEGSWGWNKTIASTTLDAGEQAVLAIAIDDAGVGRAALPLAKARDGSLRSLTAPYTTRYSPALLDPQWSRYLGEEAASYVSSTMRLDALDLDDPGVKAYFAGLEQSGLAQATFAHFANWYEAIGEFSTYWGSRPERLQSTVRRKRKAAEKCHRLSFQLVSDAESLATALDDYLSVYSSSWKEPEPHPDFIATLVRALGAEGLLRLGTLSFDGVVAAAQIWLVNGSTVTIFKLAHAERFARFSPGTILTHWLFRSICSADTCTVDFGRGDDAYKRDWLRNRRLRKGAVVANSHSLKGLGTILGEIFPMRIKFRFQRTKL